MKADTQGLIALLVSLLIGIVLDICLPEEYMIVPASAEFVEDKAVESNADVIGPRKIALTFDDGPHPVYTRQMLEVLERERVSATFFLLGQNVEENGDIVKEIAEQGHLIGNHTYHHVQITSLPPAKACEEIERTNQLIEDLTCERIEYIRPPFGTWSDELEDRLDMIPVMWSVDTLDWTTENVDEIVNLVVKNAGENDIILMHDSYESSVLAVERLIALLRAEGYEFVTVDEIIMN